MLSSYTGKRLVEALTSKQAGNEVASILNNSAYGSPIAFVAASTSTAVQGLNIGDWVLHIPATAGNAAFLTVAAANTLPAAAVVGDFYVVIRLASSAPTDFFL